MSIKPNAAPMPKPGIYWLRNASRHFGWQTQWYESEWFIGEVDKKGYITYMGSDSRDHLNAENCVVIEVGPKVEPPA